MVLHPPVPHQSRLTTYTIASAIPSPSRSEAATEFRKILDHRGIMVSDPIAALSHRQLGKAYALAGDKAKARSAYQDFFTLWKDADRNIPVLNEAEGEYAKLQ
jgi:hypothetical protein